MALLILYNCCHVLHTQHSTVVLTRETQLRCRAGLLTSLRFCPAEGVGDAACCGGGVAAAGAGAGDGAAAGGKEAGGAAVQAKAAADNISIPFNM